jgi:DNA polymerase-1
MEVLYKVIENRAELDDLICGIKLLDHVAVDIETTGLNPRSDTILCIGFAVQPDRVAIVSGDLIDLLQPLFDSPCSFVWHNGKFDTEFLFYRSIQARIDHDVLLMHYALDSTRGTHGLKQLASIYLGEVSYTDELKRYTGSGKSADYSRVPRSIMHPYLSKDAAYTYRLFELFRAMIRSDSKVLSLYESVLLTAERYLQRVTRRGILIDRTALAVIRLEQQAIKDHALVEMRTIVREVTGGRAVHTGAMKQPIYWETFNPGSPKQVGHLIYSILKDDRGKPLRPIGRTPYRWKPNTSEQTIELLPRVPFTSLLLDYRGAEKLIGTYVDGVIDRLDSDDRLRANFMLHGSVTGRLSTSPNVQNPPRQNYRHVVIAPPGYVLVELDYSQAEMRVFACLSGDPFLIDVFKSDQDLHDIVAIQLFGSTFTMEQRQLAKHTNFAVLYGSGAANIAYKFGYSIDQAESILRSWHRLVSRGSRFLTWCRAHPGGAVALETPVGRRHTWGTVHRGNLGNLMNAAGNFPIQSLASDINLVGHIEAETFAAELGARCINLVHDSGVYEVPDNPTIIDRFISGMKDRLAHIHERWIPDAVPFKVDAKVGLTWGSMKTYVGERDKVIIDVK